MMKGVSDSRLLEMFLAEDIGSGDVTSRSCPNPLVKAYIKAEHACIVAGLAHSKTLFSLWGAKAKALIKDGDIAKPKQRILEITGPAHSVLEAERTALNLLSHLSAIATKTRSYADILKKHKSKAKISATRKTTPGLRSLEKEAVILGGGLPHRMGLYDQALIKDNHLLLFDQDIKESINKVRKGLGKKRLEIEVTNVSQALEAAKAGVDIIMLDNMRKDTMEKAINALKVQNLRKGRILEVSGRVTKRRLKNLASLDIDWISTSKIVTVAGSCDFSLDIVQIK